MVLRCKRSQRLRLVAPPLLLHCIVLQARLDLASKLQRAAAQQCEERNNRTHQQQAIRSISAITK